MGNVIPEGPARTDIAAMVKIKGGGTNRTAIRKIFDERKKSSPRVFVLKNCFQ